MIINGKVFPVNSTDTADLILDRYAASLNTTPYWIWVKKGNLEDEDSVVDTVDVLEVLKRMVADSAMFKDVEAMFNEWISSRSAEKTPLKDLAQMYISMFAKENEDMDRFQQLSTLEFLFSDSGGIDFDFDFIQDALNRSDETQKNHLTAVRRIKKDVEVATRNNALRGDDTIEQTVEIKTTEFDIESEVTSFIIETDVSVVLAKVFNDMEVVDMLFVKFKSFYKVCMKQRPLFSKYDYDADTPEDLQIVFAIRQTRSRYIFKEIRISKLESDKKFKVDIDTLEDEQRFLDIVKNLLNTSITIIETQKTRIRGNFRILESSFNKVLFLDDIMNNSKFFDYAHVNERSRVSKTYNRLHVYYEDFVSKTVVFSLYNEKGDVVVNVTNISNKDYIPSFVSAFRKLFQSYKSREKMLLNEYQKFIPTLTLMNDVAVTSSNIVATTAKKVGVVKNILSEAEPTLFVPLYTRKCAKPPRIVGPDEDVGNYQTMNFPIYGEGGIKPRRFVCDQTKGFIYPGLRKNTLFNANVFKYLPCCYETNQESRANSNWNIYFNNAESKTDKYEHVLYKTSRIVPSGGNGVVPSNIAKLVGNVSRRGVFVGSNSFLDAVCRALGDKKHISDQKKRVNYLSGIRKLLDWRLCSQENYDMLDSYKNWFYDDSLYFEPRRFFRAVEEYYDVNIYTFERSTNRVARMEGKVLEFLKTSNNGILSTPNVPTSGEFIDPKSHKLSVYIYTHMGGAIDILDHPHCEYFELDPKDDVIRNMVDRVYRYILISSRTDEPVTVSGVKEQILDSMGRCVGFKTTNGKIIDLDKPQLPIGLNFCAIRCITAPADGDKNDLLSQHVYMKRFARVIVEYCGVKFVNSDEDDLTTFFSKHTKIIPDHVYPLLVSRTELTYYDFVFSDSDGNIIFDSEDTRDRVYYSLQLKKNRGDLLDYVGRDFLESYFYTTLDFDLQDGCIIVDDLASFAYSTPTGLAFNNCIDVVEDSCYLKLDSFPELTGYYRAFPSFETSLRDGKTLYPGKYTTLYIWENNTFVKYVVQDDFTGKICILYKINSVIYYLNKQN